VYWKAYQKNDEKNKMYRYMDTAPQRKLAPFHFVNKGEVPWWRAGGKESKGAAPANVVEEAPEEAMDKASAAKFLALQRKYLEANAKARRLAASAFENPDSKPVYDKTVKRINDLQKQMDAMLHV
jgi:hypothetical protein